MPVLDLRLPEAPFSLLWSPCSDRSSESRDLTGPVSPSTSSPPTTWPSTGQRWSTYWDVERLCRGPEPAPDWVVTDRAAVDTELGVLKTGKEADVFLLERAVPAAPTAWSWRPSATAARSTAPSTAARAYTEGRRTRKSRDARALDNKSSATAARSRPASGRGPSGRR